MRNSSFFKLFALTFLTLFCSTLLFMLYELEGVNHSKGPFNTDGHVQVVEDSSNLEVRLPFGSYGGTCHDCALIMDNTVLRCGICVGNNKKTATQISLTDCTSQEWISNIDGVLACDALPPGPNAADRLRSSGHYFAAEQFEARSHEMMSQQAQPLSSQQTQSSQQAQFYNYHCKHNRRTEFWLDLNLGECDSSNKYDVGTRVFTCGRGGKQLFSSRVNDNFCDCCDGSDEQYNERVQCKNTC